MNRSLGMSKSFARAQASQQTLLRQSVSACACGETCKRRRSLLPRRPRLSKPGRACQGRSPLELQSNPAACTPDSRQFLRRGACPPGEEIASLQFPRPEMRSISAETGGVHHSLKRRRRLSETRRRRSLLPSRPVPGRLRQVPVPMRIMVLEAGYVLLPSTSRPISLPSAL